MSEAGFRPQGALFDMDGLMLDTERPCITAWMEAAKNCNWSIDETIPYAVVGRDSRTSRRLFLEKYGKAFPYDDIQKEAGRLMDQYEAENGVVLKPGLLFLLDRLTALGLPLGVATSTYRKPALAKLEQAGILCYFKAAACGDEVGKGKPEPDIFLLAAERIGIKAENCAGFEDSPAGLRSLFAAGIRSVFVKDLIEPPPEVLALVWRRFERLDEAMPLFT
jgi:HAD superfamily hydrolase (TIGR01509 family)